MKRRSLLAGVIGLAGLAVGLGYRSPRRRLRLRPPGAAADFERRCIRCFRCAEVCPVRALRFDALLDLRGAYTPYVDPLASPCVLCMRCGEVCPTGALTAIAADMPTVQKHVRMGTPRLDRQACLTWSRQGNCRLCHDVCPFAGSAVRLSGVAGGPAFDPEACVGCGLCAHACPSDVRAIEIDGEVGRIG